MNLPMKMPMRQRLKRKQPIDFKTGAVALFVTAFFNIFINVDNLIILIYYCNIDYRNCYFLQNVIRQGE